MRQHELIGLAVIVHGASDPSLVGLQGVVTDETRNMVTVETAKGERKVTKKGTSFRFLVGGGVVVRGDDLLFRPEDRIKKVR